MKPTPLHLIRLAAAFAAVSCVVAKSSAVTISTFDSNTDGWTVVGDAAIPATFVATGGNPGGFLQVVDAVDGGVIYFVAPAKFLGNHSSAYGTNLQFDLMQFFTEAPDQFDDDDILLSGAGLTLAFDTATNPPNGAGSSYSVPLVETGWHLNSIAGAPATQAQMQSVLGNLTSLEIRGEFQTGADTDSIDNVRLVPEPSSVLLLLFGALLVLPMRIGFRRPAIGAVLLFTLVLAQSNSAQADIIAQTLGHQAFPDGTKVALGPFQTAHAGDPFPFDGTFSGSDTSSTGPNFSESWTFSYGAPSSITSATLALGILDSDSAATGNQVASFLLNGTIDLTVPLNAAFEANPSANSFVNDYTITLPNSAFSQLATGSATFALTLQGPGLGVLGQTTFNGAALDFSTLTITTQTTPEPSSIVLLCAGALVLAAYRRQRAR